MQALKIPIYRNYLFGSFVSEVGNQMQTVAVSWQVYELTRNPASLGLIGLSNFLPIMLFSLIGGLFADKLDRKKLLILSQLVQAGLVSVFFVLTYLQLISPLIIYILLFLHSTASSFSLPARQAVLPHLVPRNYFMNAVSLNTLQYQTATLLGPAVAGFLIAFLGVGSVYLMNAFSFVVFIVSILIIKKSLNATKQTGEVNLASIWEGVKFVISTPILYSTMILDFLATFFGTATILMPVFAKDVLHVGPTGLGLLYSAPAVGGIVAGLLLSLFHKIQHQGRLILASVGLYGVATIAFGLSSFLPLSLLFLFFVGFGDMISTIIRNTIRQMITPDHLRGRMASVMRIFFQGGPQLGEIEAGFLAKAIGGPASVVVGGVGVVVIAAVMAVKNKRLSQYQGKDLVVP